MNTPGSSRNERGPCSDRVDVLSALLDGELLSEDADRLRVHLEVCTGCRDYSTALERDHALFATRFSTIQARPDFTERVMETIRSNPEEEVETMSTITEAPVEDKEAKTEPRSDAQKVITGRDIFRKPRRRIAWVEAFVSLCLCGVVLAIIFPVFSRAREKARAASCQSNLKQIGLAFLMFEQDKGCLPNGSNWMSDLMPYIKNSQILIDPSGIGQNRGYAMNPAMSGRRLRDIANPAETALAYDAENGRVSYRHSDGCNVAFADGHVKWISKRDAEKLGLGSYYLNLLPTGGTSHTVQNAAALGRQVGYQANLSLETRSVDAAVARIETTVDQLGGFLLQSSVQSKGQSGYMGTLVARVPRHNFIEAVRTIAAVGRLKRREVVGQDVTEEYVAASQNAGETFERTTRLERAKPRRLSQNLALEKELHQVATHRTEARRELSRISGIAELATIAVSLFEPVVVPTIPPAFAAAKKLVVKVAYHGYITLGCLLICAPLWLPVLGGWWVWKRRQRQVVAPA
ncbi:MAG: DUF4349 domain-containing protein [Armatimonadetes bacterium]|nr:DUF4349 domain-containing protein [Armatimonadota bacterium]